MPSAGDISSFGSNPDAATTQRLNVTNLPDVFSALGELPCFALRTRMKLIAFEVVEEVSVVLGLIRRIYARMSTPNNDLVPDLP